MASHISGPAANSQQRQYSTDSVGEQYAPKRSSLQHISELIKLAKKRDLMGAKNAAVMPWIVPRHHRVIKPEENFDVSAPSCVNHFD